MSPWRILYWSVRRELWEHRAIWIGPLAVAVLAVVGIMVSILRNLDKVRAAAALEPAKQAVAIALPYNMAASAIVLTGFVVGAYYCIDALNAERRDRSILFWKSMPVSDLLTVISKAIVPFAIQPLVAFAIALGAQLVLLVLINIVRVSNGLDAAVPRLHWITFVMAYGIAVHALWYFPIYAALLLISVAARRAALLWVILPPFAIYVLEWMAYGVSPSMAMLRYRLLGATELAWAIDALRKPVIHISQLDPLRFLSAPGLWLGLLFAVACLFAAVRLRPRREPI